MGESANSINTGAHEWALTPMASACFYFLMILTESVLMQDYLCKNTLPIKQCPQVHMNLYIGLRLECCAALRRSGGWAVTSQTTLGAGHSSRAIKTITAATAVLRVSARGLAENSRSGNHQDSHRFLAAREFGNSSVDRKFSSWRAADCARASDALSCSTAQGRGGLVIGVSEDRRWYPR